MTSFDGYTCACCGKWFDELPAPYSYDSPFYWPGLSEEEKKASFLTPDVCEMRRSDGTFFFVRGVIEIPIVGESEPLLWGVWSSLSEANFRRFIDLYNDPKRVDEPPYFSWLSSRIKGYPDTLSLKANVTTPTLEERPKIKLEPTDHPLALEQQRGIRVERVREIAALFHSHKSSPASQ